MKKIKIPFREQVLVEIKVGDEVIAKGYADFIIAEVLITGTARPNQKVTLYAMESGYVQNIKRQDEFPVPLDITYHGCH